MPKPIKRHPSLQPLSRDHHHGLLFCWKIRSGIKRHIDPERMQNHAKWFWKEHLVVHFAEEEELVFPVLGNQHELVAQALEEHKLIEEMFSQEEMSYESLQVLQQKLDDHIRFEERNLFNVIQEVATAEQMVQVEKHLGAEHPEAEYEDDYWTWKKTV